MPRSNQDVSPRLLAELERLYPTGVYPHSTWRRPEQARELHVANADLLCENTLDQPKVSR